MQANTNKQKFDKIMEWKISTPTDVLCHGFPDEFSTFLNYTHALHFGDKPDYSYLHKLFHDLFFCEGYQHDSIFDWTQSPECNVEDNPNSSSGPKITTHRMVVQEGLNDQRLVMLCPRLYYY